MGIRGKKTSSGQHSFALVIHVTPGARKNEISQILEDGSLKIRLTAPPVEGKANEALLKLLSKILKVSPSHLTIVSGFTARKKRVIVDGLSEEDIQERLLSQLSP
jgi:uncharacterized protein